MLSFDCIWHLSRHSIWNGFCHLFKNLFRQYFWHSICIFSLVGQLWRHSKIISFHSSNLFWHVLCNYLLPFCLAPMLASDASLIRFGMHFSILSGTHAAFILAFYVASILINFPACMPTCFLTILFCSFLVVPCIPTHDLAWFLILYLPSCPPSSPSPPPGLTFKPVITVPCARPKRQTQDQCVPGLSL